jgi:predicted secreted acid phosphatase
VVICFNENFITYINDNGVSIMPLVKGKKASSKKGFGENVKREMHEGKPQKQAVAIAYSEARRGKKGKSKKKKDTY